jgi:hypothetical protein
VNGRVACNVEELSKLLTEFQQQQQQQQQQIEGSEERIYEFDHIYDLGKVNESRPQVTSHNVLIPRVFLYSALGTKNFFEFHKILSEKAKRREIQYIFRHYLHSPLKRSPQLLQGYAAELQLKNIEYKVIDVQQMPHETEEFDENEPEISGMIQQKLVFSLFLFLSFSLSLSLSFFSFFLSFFLSLSLSLSLFLNKFVKSYPFKILKYYQEMK